jgi:hypothetical protein
MCGSGRAPRYIRHVRTRPALLFLCLVSLLVAGCAKGSRAPETKPQHPYRAPHQGTIVVLGRDEFHLELVRDAAAGTVTAYLFNETVTIPVRSKSSGFEIIATVDGQKRTLAFTPQPDATRGETAGDTARFSAGAGWLKTTPKFEAEIPLIKLLNTTFLHVKFPFPAGNEARS